MRYIFFLLKIKKENRGTICGEKVIKEIRYGYIDGFFTGKIINKKIYLDDTEESVVKTAKMMINIQTDDNVDEAMLGEIFYFKTFRILRLSVIQKFLTLD